LASGFLQPLMAMGDEISFYPKKELRNGANDVSYSVK
jgi:hypothetical protein